ncbi:hypothetical protein EPUS_08467 [Endocarpon pusillum Z07020]|uniref:Scytalone dehydratase-like domain-containing protein n=1 Tax=Endocarpon pusillum (strain Z07020 / HMAS-L-300199) TaxID=1263415 RepID=U1GXE4_ENDPU|nr:uncharacterized protein EPUS_08467 [Endocarpon pusillum Z07020]ERF77163.1 hypothetical protein EPUS_08467 [Endocarpon pusillum Z07020]
MTQDITFEDIASLNATLFEWAESYDTKDWARLRRCLAPTLRPVDYRYTYGQLWESMPADAFLA